MGLDIFSSDTDEDGLSDYDEINTYHSDPKKFSTSGDLLSDYYKVNHQLDVNKKYDTVPSISMDNEDINLVPKRAEDVEAYYKEYNGIIPSGYILGMKPFRIFSFTGDVEIKIDNPNYYDVYSYNTISNSVNKLKSKVVDEKIVFSIKNDFPILISFKNKYVELINKNANSIFHPVFDNPVDNEYIVVAMPFFNVFFHVPVLIFQINDSNHYLEQKYNNPDSKISVNVKYIGSQEAKVLDSFFAGFIKKLQDTAEIDDDSFFDYFFYYRHIRGSNKLEELLSFEEEGEENEEKSKEKEKPIVLENPYDEKYQYNTCNYCADSGFNVSQNAFRFENPSTTASQNGICVGIAHFTTNAFNHTNFPKKKDNIYDMSSDSYNDIWNGNLYQYIPTSKLKDYADEVRGNESVLDPNNITYPDNQLIMALDYYWEKVNEDVRWSKFSWAWNNSFENVTPIDADSIDEMIEQFRNNKIVSILLLSEGQHAINAYKIVEDPNDEDILYLKVYDSNFPNDMFWNKSGGKEKCDLTITLYRKYKTNVLRETKTYYLFEYSPLNSKNYYWKNTDDALMGLLILDENGDVLG